jgi:hypothetical protein
MHYNTYEPGNVKNMGPSLFPGASWPADKASS